MLGSFAAIRTLILAIAVLSQVFLFFMVIRGIVSLLKKEPWRSAAVGAAAIAMVGLSYLYWYTYSRPMRWVDPPWLVSLAFYYLPAIWVVGSIFSAAALAFAQGLFFVGKALFRKFMISSASKAGTKGASPDALPPDPERRIFVQAAMGAAAAAPLLITGYGALDESKSFHVREISVPFGRRLNVVLLSDVHSGIYLTGGDVRRCADIIHDLKPDLFLMAGDYITNSMRYMPACLREVSRIKAIYGTYACLGNHEHWHGDVDELEKIFARYRIPLLNNAHEVIPTGQGPLAVIGIEDLVAGDPDLKGAMEGIEAGIPRILLSHRPEIFPEAASRGISLTLSGHYHGGQIALKIPGRKFSLAGLRTPYPEGLYRIRDSYLYVTSGIGTTFTPVRLNAPPEITLLHLT